MEMHIELLHAIIDHLHLVITHHPVWDQTKNKKTKLLAQN